MVAPADSNELVAQVREALESPFPTYMRIGKKGEQSLHRKSARLGIAKGNLLRDGSDLLMMGVGPILGEAVQAAETLSHAGISVAVASLGGVKPLDEGFLRAMAERFQCWLSLEEHGITGGLGSALLEWLADQQYHSIRLKRLGVPDRFLHELGSQAYTRRQLGLEKEGITLTIRQVIEETKR